MKKLFTMTLVTVLLVLAVFTAAVSAETPAVTVELDKNPIAFDVPPQIIDGRTMVPLRAIFEALGAEVTWDGETSTAKATKGDTKISITINEKVLYKNDTAVELDVPAMLIDSRTLVPVRAISESLDVLVGWDGVKYIVSLTSKKAETLTAEGFVPGNGFAASGKDGTTLSEEDRKVTVAAADGGVAVSHGGYYTNGDTWGGVASKDKFLVNGIKVTVKFDQVPTVVDGEDCWAYIGFLNKPELFKVGAVANNKGFMNLIRFSNKKWELYEGVSSFKNVNSISSATEMFSLKSGDVVTVTAKLVNGFYEFTYTNGSNSVSYVYENAEFTNVFEEGMAHVVIAASCNGSTKDAFKYTITEISHF